MREWRKLHRGIVASDKLTRVSDSAGLLFCFLLAVQDDAGRYPWTPAKIRALTITRTWEVQSTYQILMELVRAHLVTLENGFVTIVGGAEKNGAPTSGTAAYKALRLYEIDTTIVDTSTVRTEYVQDTSSVPTRGEEKRLEEKREETEGAISQKPQSPAPPVKSKRDKIVPLDEAFRQRMVQDYAEVWSEQDVLFIIAEAMNHEAQKKRPNKQLYVQGWLRREAERQGGRDGNRAGSRNGNSNVSPQHQGHLDGVEDAAGKRVSPFAKYG
ncbi:hypothetical protein HY493_02450 [Candidatus Woesearchaeota archaeon]|nr:hypothetical protein [Candidatus Woesearchaeota archaeon]